MEVAARNAVLPLHRGASRNVVLRLRVWATNQRLDAELAAGAPPGLSPAFAERVRQLRRPRYRRSLAAGLERAVRVAESDRRSLGSSLPVARREVLCATEDLLAIAGRLRADEPLAPAGLAAVAGLVTDSSSLLFRPWPDRPLWRHVRDTADQLDAGPR